MRTLHSVMNGNTVALENDAHAETETLIRQLVDSTKCQCEVPAHPQQEQEREEIILDKDVDGTRYLLVRLPKPTRTPVMLSPREQEIVRMVAKGHPNKTIAAVLNISSWTVCTHLRRIFAKLGVGSRAAMVARTLEDGRVRDQISSFEKPNHEASSRTVSGACLRNPERPRKLPLDPAGSQSR